MRMWWALVSATAISDSPIRKFCLSVCVPYTPGEASTPSRLPTKRTSVCAGQYLRVRNQRVEGPSQYHAPTTGLEVHRWSARSTAARSSTGRLNASMTGMPTP